MTTSFTSIWTEAISQVDGHASGPDSRTFVLVFGLNYTLRRDRIGLEEMLRFLDPQTPCASLGGDPGWSLQRRPERGERHRHFTALNARDPNRAVPWPVPGPEEAASPDWPDGARYLAEADVPEDLWDPAYPEAYFTAAEMHAYIRRLMPVYARYHPESEAQCERIVALSQYWVDLDTKKGASPT